MAWSDNHMHMDTTSRGRFRRHVESRNISASLCSLRMRDSAIDGAVSECGRKYFRMSRTHENLLKIIKTSYVQ